ncbi:two-component response regulator [Fusarium heterosporum]|uniref:Two-component response regulator n=1 Tax=Fusarium heterosporum TaxID=42747 RepID=A0A8H5TIE1_FUSHE|nr:two-component response regulator [Fusarium heterosporum]
MQKQSNVVLTVSQTDGNMSEIEQQGSAPQTINSTVVPDTNSSVEDAEFLLVDDNKVNVKSMSNIFDKLGLKYQIAWDGQEAFDIYKAHPERCRMILMDISMPVLDGMRATKMIRSYESEKNLQPAVIVGLVAADVESEKERLVNEFGMNTTLKKPMRVGAVQEVLDGWLI